MIILIAGTTHTGKTALAQKLMEKYKYPYLSLDHLKMGLIRSGMTKLGVDDDEKLTPFLWNIAKEIVKTAIENGQNLIIEGCYIPFDWRKDFEDGYLADIKYVCLVMTRDYIEKKFSNIVSFENVIEKRKDSADLSKAELIKENANNLKLCKKFKLDYILIDKDYVVDFKV